MDNMKSGEERREHPRYSVKLPLDYWETRDVVQGGVVANISERGLLFHSVHKISVGAKLGIRVYLTRDYNLDCIEGKTRIIWMNHHQEEDWNGYKYGLHITQMGSNDRDRLLKYFLMLKEAENSRSGEKPFDKYEDYLFDLSNRERNACLRRRGLGIISQIMRRIMTFKRRIVNTSHI